MEASEILASVRPLVLVVDSSGIMLDARGGAGGFLGHEPNDLVGRPVFDIVAPDALADVAGYFARLNSGPSPPVLMPMPFRSIMSGSDGLPYGVDVIPTGVVAGGGERSWVLMLVPQSMQTSVSEPLNAELTGAGRDIVRSRLCDELCYHNQWGSLRWYFVALENDPQVFGPRSDPGLTPVLQRAVDRGWRPWSTPTLAVDDASRPPSADDVLLPCPAPSSVTTAALRFAEPDQEFRIGFVPVELDGELIGVYLELRWVPAAGELLVRANVLTRIGNLCQITALLHERWRDRDRLVLAATRDTLTGLANRDALTDAIDAADGQSAVLYVDVDCFKSVNDRFGHAVGDRVLVEIAHRIVASCRPGDVVARFGGDEFVVLLEGIDLETAEMIGHRIIESVAEPLGMAGAPDRVSSSVGVSACRPGADPVDLADRAMLVAKRSGRAQLVVG